jgi:hypothetical protein
LEEQGLNGKTKLSVFLAVEAINPSSDAIAFYVKLLFNVFPYGFTYISSILHPIRSV